MQGLEVDHAGPWSLHIVTSPLQANGWNLSSSCIAQHLSPGSASAIAISVNPGGHIAMAHPTAVPHRRYGDILEASVNPHRSALSLMILRRTEYARASLG
ncbi:hypothetical protein AC579_2838 [Pseudocercospora musae]|uniref:Uncharacterized protein n=1 Tax=Pseudocercospora musae TaxID=113226 RepID=A0A139GWJ6_9PEZI|nr:hypothetical protein AC579_2838 [Pseudocercospora musae]